MRVIIHLMPKRSPDRVEAFLTARPPHDKHSFSCCRTTTASPRDNASHPKNPPHDPDCGIMLAPGPIAGGWAAGNSLFLPGGRSLAGNILLHLMHCHGPRQPDSSRSPGDPAASRPLRLLPCQCIWPAERLSPAARGLRRGRMEESGWRGSPRGALWRARNKSGPGYLNLRYSTPEGSHRRLPGQRPGKAKAKPVPGVPSLPLGVSRRPFGPARRAAFEPLRALPKASAVLLKGPCGH